MSYYIVVEGYTWTCSHSEYIWWVITLLLEDMHRHAVIASMFDELLHCYWRNAWTCGHSDCIWWVITLLLEDMHEHVENENFGLNSHFHTFLSLCNYMHFLTLTYFNYLVWVSSFKTYSIKNQKNTLRRSFQLWFCYLINYQKKLTPLFVINPFLISSQQALIIAFACNAKNFAIAILFSSLSPGHCFWTDHQKSFYKRTLIRYPGYVWPRWDVFH